VTIGTLLVPLFESADDRHAILHAVQIATPFKAHVTVMFSGGPLSEILPAEPLRYGRVRHRAMVEGQALLDEQINAARATFDSLVQERGLTVADEPGAHSGATVSFEVRRGSIDATAQEAAVYHDLVVFSRKSDPAPVEPQPFSTIKSVLQSCGRPLLILPEILPRSFASSIAIGWNGSIEGSHAVRAAMPMLARAKSIYVLTVPTRKTSADQASKLQSYLAWRGLRAEICTPDPRIDSVGATLLGMVYTVGAGLFVLGGYTHSRIRQTFLGGVTHHVVQHARVPVLLSK
jgi:hypothetical protein